MTEIGPRLRNLALFAIGACTALVVYDYLTGAQWMQFVGGLLGALLA